MQLLWIVQTTNYVFYCKKKLFLPRINQEFYAENILMGSRYLWLKNKHLWKYNFLYKSDLSDL